MKKMIKRTIKLLAIVAVLMSSNVLALDKECINTVSAKYNLCMANHPGQVRAARRCQQTFRDEIGPCAGAHTLSRCEERAADRFIRCQINYQDRRRLFRRRNRAASECKDHLERQLGACEQEESAGSDS